MVQGFLFGMSQVKLNQWIYCLTHVLNQTLGYEPRLPEQELANLESILQNCLSLEFMIDGRECRISGSQTPHRGIKRGQILV